MKYMRIDVDIPTATLGEVSPLRFRLGAHIIEIVDVVDRWHGRNTDHYRVRGHDGHTYVLKRLRESEGTPAWEMVSFTHRDSRGTSPMVRRSDTLLQ